MSLPEILLRLAAHEDSARPTPSAEPGQTLGFQGIHLTPRGRWRVLWHWGARTFADQAELEAWLAGRTPASWVE